MEPSSTRAWSCVAEKSSSICARNRCAADSSVDRLAVVHRVDLRLELLRDDLTLHLERRGEVPRLLREIATEAGEPLDRLVGRQGRVELIDRRLDLRAPRIAARGRRAGAGGFGRFGAMLHRLAL